ncbi:MAG TPA: FG-GAP-like repeat-containing protein [Bacteroidota bacterium]|nr:FG-GAP-like repeat-containing protein [Bacteroidota bacterium]
MRAKDLSFALGAVTLFLAFLVCEDIVMAQKSSGPAHSWIPFSVRNIPKIAPSGTPTNIPPRSRPARAATIDSTSFTLYPSELAGVFCGDAVWVDYDNDGDLDILVSGMGDSIPLTKIYRNDNGVFTDIGANIPGIVSEHGVAWGDYDNDGDYDLAITGNLTPDSGSFTPITKIYRNDNGTFVDVNAPLIQVMGSVCWVDYDNDGKLDLFVTGAHVYSGEFQTVLYHNDGNDTFTPVPFTFPGVWASSIAWGDYNNDGYPDVLITGYGDWGVTSELFMNNCAVDSSTPFIDAGSPFQATNHCGVAWGDYDNDGYADVVISGDPPTWTWNTFSTIYHNNGDGTFTDIKPGIDQLSFSSVAWGDYDNDGLPDLAICGWLDDSTNVLKIFHNDGGGHFTDINANLPAVWWGSVAWGDVDNDGRLDLLISGGSIPQAYFNLHPPYVPITQIYHNNLSVAPNRSPSTPAGFAASVTDHTVQFSWDQTTDDHTPVHALSYNLRVGTSPGASDIVAPSSNVATGYRRIPKSGSSGNHLTRSLTLPTGKYYWSVQAIDNGYSGSGFTEEKPVLVGVIPHPISNWYMVSVPNGHDDMTKTDLFPDAMSYAFTYSISYQLADTLKAGVGYWLKYAVGTAPKILDGVGIPTLSIPVEEGWNMIGSISVPVSTSAIVSDPSGMTTSSFFTYNGTYQKSNTIEPGTGYWVKVNQAGTLNLSASSVAGAGTIRIVENGDAPPSPPEGDAPSKKNILPAAFGLEQNYPNPFNPSTSIRYMLPADSRVVLKVYNLLGQVVATLVSGLQTAGTKEARWDAGAYSSGIYFYRMEATNVTNLHDGYSQTGKMLLIK